MIIHLSVYKQLNKHRPAHSLLFLPQVHGEVIPPLALNRDASRLGGRDKSHQTNYRLKKAWLAIRRRERCCGVNLYIYIQE